MADQHQFGIIPDPGNGSAAGQHFFPVQGRIDVSSAGEQQGIGMVQCFAQPFLIVCTGQHNGNSACIGNGMDIILIQDHAERFHIPAGSQGNDRFGHRDLPHICRKT